MASICINFATYCSRESNRPPLLYRVGSRGHSVNSSHRLIYQLVRLDEMEFKRWHTSCSDEVNTVVRSSYLSEIYFDAAASAPLLPQVADVMHRVALSFCGNTSSMHSAGRRANELLQEARTDIASTVACQAEEVIFTSGGTEADNLALQGTARAINRPLHIIASSIEHQAILRTAQVLEQQGVEITLLSPNSHGVIELSTLESAMRPNTALVSIMLVNNEIGTVQPIRGLAQIAHRHRALFHTDAVQALGKIPIDFRDLGVDMMSLSAHKIHGPKGVGALIVKRGTPIHPLLLGGGQEHGLRSGTENLAGIAGFAAALRLAIEHQHEWNSAVLGLRESLEAGIRAIDPEARIIGEQSDRVSNVSNVCIESIDGSLLRLTLQRRQICVSSGSACNSGSHEPSHVLTALGLSDQAAGGAIRFSFSHLNTLEEVESALSEIRAIVSIAKAPTSLSKAERVGRVPAGTSKRRFS